MYEKPSMAFVLLIKAMEDLPLSLQLITYVMRSKIAAFSSKLPEQVKQDPICRNIEFAYAVKRNGLELSLIWEIHVCLWPKVQGEVECHSTPLCIFASFLICRICAAIVSHALSSTVHPAVSGYVSVLKSRESSS